MTKLSLGQAAKHAKRSKGTISKALNNGNLAGVKVKKNGRDTWEINPAELQRWMEVNPLKTVQEVQNTTSMETVENANKTSALEVEVKLLREMLEKSETQCRKWEAQAEKITAVIEDQREKPKGLWARLTRG